MLSSVSDCRSRADPCFMSDIVTSTNGLSHSGQHVRIPISESGDIGADLKRASDP